jgi:hypothetical protein
MRFQKTLRLFYALLLFTAFFSVAGSAANTTTITAEQEQNRVVVQLPMVTVSRSYDIARRCG